MLILNADEAKKIVLMKRSVRPGCARIDKEVFCVPGHGLLRRQRAST